MASVLFIGDEGGGVLDTFGRALGHGGHACVVEGTRTQGIAAAARTRPDVAVVDMRLPDIDSMEVIRAIRQASPTTAVIVMTGYATIESCCEAMKRGACEYLQKPVDVDVFVSIVRRVLANGNGHARNGRPGSADERGYVGGHDDTTNAADEEWASRVRAHEVAQETKKFEVRLGSPEPHELERLLEPSRRFFAADGVAALLAAIHSAALRIAADVNVTVQEFLRALRCDLEPALLHRRELGPVHH
jgi:ActR/RegA family two-component response regulator